MIHHRVIIIGGGAGGLFSFHLLPSSLLIEKNTVPGLKLLITGNGKCNLTHGGEREDVVTHYYDKKHFVTPSIYVFPPDMIRSHFSSLGVETYIREDDKVFPVSGKSSDIRDALLKEKQNILSSTSVLCVKKKNEIFIVETDNGTFSADFVVLATGGMTYPGTGSTGDGYRIASSLGHTIITPEPALSPLVLNVDTTSIEGVSVKNITLTIEKKSYSGDIVFTRNGISGPAAENISHYARKGVDLIIRFVERIESTDVKRENGKTNVINALSRLTSLPRSLLLFLFKSIKDKTVAVLTKSDLRLIEETMLSFTLTIKGRNINQAMVTKGGVDTKEVDSKTMESRKVKNLYFSGEILDVDGECGGYNLTFAFASAYSAITSIKNRIDCKGR